MARKQRPRDPGAGCDGGGDVAPRCRRTAASRGGRLRWWRRRRKRAASWSAWATASLPCTCCSIQSKTTTPSQLWFRRAVSAHDTSAEYGQEKVVELLIAKRAAPDQVHPTQSGNARLGETGRDCGRAQPGCSERRALPQIVCRSRCMHALLSADTPRTDRSRSGQPALARQR